MLLLILIVAFSPVLVFKGLTVETLMQFFNLHPFLLLLLILDIIRSPFTPIYDTLTEICKRKAE